VDGAYKTAAIELGRRIAGKGMDLIYGGARVGLMGLVAVTAKKHGARITGVIPKRMRQLAFDGCDEVIITKDLRERKALMESRSDAFLVLPGGFGTLEETVEVLTLKQLNEHDKPIVFLNVNGFYSKLIELFETFYEECFAKPANRDLYRSCSSVAEAFEYLAAYEPPRKIQKWF
jgi:uncharacterized protein (TIGR00730 family)